MSIVVASVKGSRTVKLIPFIIGIGVGYILALILTVIGNTSGIASLQIMNFQPFIDEFSPVSFRSFFDVPSFFFMKAINTKGQYLPIDGAAIGNIALIYVPIAVVELAQHIADHKNLGSIINRDLIIDPGLIRL